MYLDTQNHLTSPLKCTAVCNVNYGPQILPHANYSPQTLPHVNYSPQTLPYENYGLQTLSYVNYGPQTLTFVYISMSSGEALLKCVFMLQTVS